jgi:HK97 family phage portal protein
VAVVSNDEQRNLLADPDSWLAMILAGRTVEGRGPVITPKTALGISAYFASIRNISVDCGMIPCKVYQRIDDRVKQEAREHPAYRLVHDEPNPDMTACSFWETFVAHACGHKGGFAEIQREESGYPIALWPLDPNAVTLMRSPSDRRLVYKVSVEGVDHFITADNMLHVHGLGFDGLTGYLVSTLGKTSLSIAMGAAEFSASFFEHGAVGSGMLKIPNALSTEAFERLRKSFAERYSGSQKAHKPILLEDNTEWIPNTTDPQRSQMIEALNFGIEDVCRWFRMPRSKVQYGDGKYNSISAENTAYVVEALLPWLVRIEQECNRKLLMPNERQNFFIKHNVRALLRGDMTTQSQFYREMRWLGVYSANDILEHEDENPIPDGDARFVPANMIPLDIAVKGQQGRTPANPTEPDGGDPSMRQPEEASAFTYYPQYGQGGQYRSLPSASSTTRAIADYESATGCANTTAPVAVEQAILSANTTLLAKALERMERIQLDKYQRAIKRGAPVEWYEEFAAQHVEHVASGILEVLEAYAVSAVAVLKNSVYGPDLALLVRTAAKNTARRHVVQAGHRIDGKEAESVEAEARAALVDLQSALLEAA